VQQVLVHLLLPGTSDTPRTGTPLRQPKQPGLVQRAASGLKTAAGKVADYVGMSTKRPADRTEPTITTPTPTPTPTRAQDSSIEKYVQNWAGAINKAASQPEKIALAKEIINFLGDRAGQPETERAKTQALSVLKRSDLGNPSMQSKFMRALKTGAKMERRDYAIARMILESLGLTWRDLDIKVVLSESTTDYVVLKSI
jgi:hypothetical protein